MRTKDLPLDFNAWTTNERNLWLAAYELAVIAHEGQVDKGGKPYIEHVLHVSANCETKDAKICGLLHDVIEDSPKYAPLLERFPNRITRAVNALTHRENESYEAYLARVVENPIARQVKLADLAHNSDVKRLKTITEADLERVKKYQRAHRLLTVLAPL